MSGSHSDLNPKKGRRLLSGLAALAAGLVLGCAPVVAGQRHDPTLSTTPIDCPRSVGAGVTCLSLQDAAGAWLIIAKPANWNGRLIVHAHGGPRLGEPEREDSLEDLDRFSVMVRQGYAWIGSSYRRGGYGVRSAAEDVDRSRAVFWGLFGRPERTLLHGQSWGGNVAAKTAELYGTDEAGTLTYDGVLLTNGVLNGGTRAYQFRADLRAVYQYVCGNHPAPSDPQYPVWQGLPAGAQMSRAELRRRIVDCTGIGLSGRDRTAQQSRRKRDILAVTGLEEDELIAHMNWATFTFQDLVQVRLGGRNPFDNSRTVYSGSSDDTALNAGVERFTADPEAVAMLAHDADLTGQIVAPTMTLHALHDPTVFYAAEAVYAETVDSAGRSHLLVQAATDEDQHSKLEDASYLTVLAALERWIDTGERPDPTRFQQDCVADHTPRSCRFVTPTLP
ncbi:MAG: hypothetical protein KKF88_03170 [Alphaproteobacteria bacterium]|nr:hypothetical protein [Alphaproteobacteria bacterium]